MKNLGAKDIVAIVVIVGIMALRLKGVNGSLDSPIALILGYYFAHRANGVDKGV